MRINELSDNSNNTVLFFIVVRLVCPRWTEFIFIESRQVCFLENIKRIRQIIYWSIWKDLVIELTINHERKKRENLRKYKEILIVSLNIFLLTKIIPLWTGDNLITVIACLWNTDQLGGTCIRIYCFLVLLVFLLPI